MLMLLDQLEQAGSTLRRDEVGEGQKVQPCSEFCARGNSNLVGPLIDAVTSRPWICYFKLVAVITKGLLPSRFVPRGIHWHGNAGGPMECYLVPVNFESRNLSRFRARSFCIDDTGIQFGGRSQKA